MDLALYCNYWRPPQRTTSSTLTIDRLDLVILPQQFPTTPTRHTRFNTQNYVFALDQNQIPCLLQTSSNRRPSVPNTVKLSCSLQVYLTLFRPKHPPTQHSKLDPLIIFLAHVLLLLTSIVTRPTVLVPRDGTTFVVNPNSSERSALDY